ncbi:ester cyclase [Aureimonas leprariae]|uniref:Ester cyclase n=1 Tax=Plantimonas leprariae TaxID=2615207 RepID=A0A7V7PKP5_9HYPH|nr:ester cyclase [Aureimonas leprariae]KAB0676309.1 ester cyclase [Aureimonas leprariae]
MAVVDLAAIYGRYIECLNQQDWANLGEFVRDDAVHNGRPLGLSGYQAMLEEDFRTIPDLRFLVDLLVCQPPHVAARLWFECTPAGRFLGLDAAGRRLSFAENVFYRFRDGRIAEVWSVVDKAAIEAQIR